MKTIAEQMDEILEQTEDLKKSIAEFEGTAEYEDKNMYPEDDYGVRPDDYDTQGFTLEDIRGQY